MSEIIPTPEPEPDWREEAAAEAWKLFPNSGIRPTASLLARTHRFAIDYLRQCPALVVYCPYPLRKLHAWAAIPSNFTAILALRKIPSSELSQVIPRTRRDQVRWMQALRYVPIILKDHHNLSPDRTDRAWRWAVRAISVEIHASGRAIPPSTLTDLLGDFLRHNELHPVRMFAAACAAQERWHDELCRTRAAQVYGSRYRERADYGPLPLEWSTDVFVQSPEELFEEGAAMRHCVASYTPQVMNRRSRIYSIRHGGERVATLEVVLAGERAHARQVKTVRNTDPGPRVQAAVSRFIAHLDGIPKNAAARE
jgi:hypothetical protein